MSWSACPERLRVLILGGSAEASALAARLAGHPLIDATISLAGRTAVPAPLPLPVRSGGFGGVDGLVAYLKTERTGAIVDATHPFAERMSRHAVVAAALTGTPLVRLTRPPWRPGPGDRWTEIADIEAAVQALGSRPRRVFLTTGRLQLAAFARAPRHFYLVRTIDPAGDGHGLVNARFIEARPPFTVDDEVRLMTDHEIDIVVTKNSGGAVSAGKLEAARRLGLPVILIARPAHDGPHAVTIDGVVAALETHARRPEKRGV